MAARVGLLCMLASIPAWAVTNSDSASVSHNNGHTAFLAKQLALPTQKSLEAVGQFEAEGISELGGGLHAGTAYDGVLQVGVAANTGPLGLWQGGQLHISGIQIQGGLPSKRLIGDRQGASNLAAHDAARIYEFWYRQRFSWKQLTLRSGLIDLNQHFVTTEYANVLINSSFGVPPTISANVQSSIYPKPGFGAMASGHSGNWDARAGVFQGHPEIRNQVLHHGDMIIGELRYRQLKLGAWRYTQPQDSVTGTPDHNWGAYGILQQELAGHSTRRLDCFLQLGASPSQANPVPYYLGTGLLIKGPVHGRPDDRLAAGLASAWVRGTGMAAEVAYEVTYLYRFSNYVYLQPDLQYIENPGGTGAIPDAVVGFLRLHLAFY
ncbi:MAG: carbohydrate porin [Acidiferrobacterales bacterium]